MTRTSRPLLIGAVLAGVLVLAVAVALRPGRMHHALARNARLTSCDSQTVAVGLTCPEDRLFQLVLGFDGLPYDPDMARPPSEFSGTICVFRDGAEVLFFRIDTETAQPCNWLDREEGICAFLLAWKMPRDRDLDDVMVPGQRYTIQVDFDVAPASATSLWFSWVQERPGESDLAIVREPIRQETMTTAPVETTSPTVE